MFLEEAAELFDSADTILLEAEANGDLTNDEMNQLFRDVHTLKGSGASVELSYFAELTHDVENLMDKLRNHQITYIPQMAETLIDALDIMKEILDLEVSGDITKESFTEVTTNILVDIREFIDGRTPAHLLSSETPAATNAPVAKTQQSNERTDHKTTCAHTETRWAHSQPDDVTQRPGGCTPKPHGITPKSV